MEGNNTLDAKPSSRDLEEQSESPSAIITNNTPTDLLQSIEEIKANHRVLVEEKYKSAIHVIE